MRVDRGVDEGDAIGTRYDPMIAKLIAHGATREEAIAKLRAALAETEVGGVTTNLPFLRWLVAHPAFHAATQRPTSSLVTRRFHSLRRHCPSRPGGGRSGSTFPPPRLLAPPDLDDPAHAHGGGEIDDEIVAPMPGTVIRVHVAAGDEVGARDPLVVVEAMKMEMPLLAPRAGTVQAVHVGEGDTVARGEVLVELED